MAAAERAEQAGNVEYHDDHMGAIFKEGFSFSGYERDLLAWNRSDGRFENISGVSGVDSISDGRGSVFGDFDNDGDSDIFLTTVQGEAHFLYRNNVGNQNGFVRVSLEGTRSGRDAFGAVVRVKSSAGVQAKLKSGGAGYLSHHDSRLLFGLGGDAAAEWVEITWPGGDKQRFERVPAGSAIHVVEGRPDFTTVAENRFRLTDPLDETDSFLAGLGLRRGERFPDLNLLSSSGDALGAHDLLKDGRSTLVNVWATWCTPCALEMPELQRLYPQLERSDIDLVGISVDLDTVESVPEYVKDRKITYPIYTTDEATLETLYPRGEATVPLTVLLDSRGTVLEIHSGWSHEEEQALRKLVR